MNLLYPVIYDCCWPLRKNSVAEKRTPSGTSSTSREEQMKMLQNCYLKFSVIKFYLEFQLIVRIFMGASHVSLYFSNSW